MLIFKAIKPSALVTYGSVSPGAHVDATSLRIGSIPGPVPWPAPLAVCWHRLGISSADLQVQPGRMAESCMHCAYVCGMHDALQDTWQQSDMKNCQCIETQPKGFKRAWTSGRWHHTASAMPSFGLLLPKSSALET